MVSSSIVQPRRGRGSAFNRGAGRGRGPNRGPSGLNHGGRGNSHAPRSSADHESQRVPIPPSSPEQERLRINPTTVLIRQLKWLEVYLTTQPPLTIEDMQWSKPDRREFLKRAVPYRAISIEAVELMHRESLAILRGEWGDEMRLVKHLWGVQDGEEQEDDLGSEHESHEPKKLKGGFFEEMDFPPLGSMEKPLVKRDLLDFSILPSRKLQKTAINKPSTVFANLFNTPPPSPEKPPPQPSIFKIVPNKKKNTPSKPAPIEKPEVLSKIQPNFTEDRESEKAKQREARDSEALSMKDLIPKFEKLEIVTPDVKPELEIMTGREPIFSQSAAISMKSDALFTELKAIYPKENTPSKPGLPPAPKDPYLGPDGTISELVAPHPNMVSEMLARDPEPAAFVQGPRVHPQEPKEDIPPWKDTKYRVFPKLSPRTPSLPSRKISHPELNCVVVLPLKEGDPVEDEEVRKPRPVAIFHNLFPSLDVQTKPKDLTASGAEEPVKESRFFPRIPKDKVKGGSPTPIFGFFPDLQKTSDGKQPQNPRIFHGVKGLQRLNVPRPSIVCRGCKPSTPTPMKKKDKLAIVCQNSKMSRDILAKSVSNLHKSQRRSKTTAMANSSKDVSRNPVTQVSKLCSIPSNLELAQQPEPSISVEQMKSLVQESFSPTNWPSMDVQKYQNCTPDYAGPPQNQVLQVEHISDQQMMANGFKDAPQIFSEYTPVPIPENHSESIEQLFRLHQEQQAVIHGCASPLPVPDTVPHRPMVRPSSRIGKYTAQMNQNQQGQQVKPPLSGHQASLLAQFIEPALFNYPNQSPSFQNMGEFQLQQRSVQQPTSSNDNISRLHTKLNRKLKLQDEDHVTLPSKAAPMPFQFRDTQLSQQQQPGPNFQVSLPQYNPSSQHIPQQNYGYRGFQQQQQYSAVRKPSTHDQAATTLHTHVKPETPIHRKPDSSLMSPTLGNGRLLSLTKFSQAPESAMRLVKGFNPPPPSPAKGYLVNLRKYIPAQKAHQQPAPFAATAPAPAPALTPTPSFFAPQTVIPGIQRTQHNQTVSTQAKSWFSGPSSSHLHQRQQSRRPDQNQNQNQSENQRSAPRPGHFRILSRDNGYSGNMAPFLAKKDEEK